ncbi:Hypothetical predicted protein [Octopus vulgaris]|uniref:Uncharacterized protein n=1 Tax=Octopus vulgaris TaxID=6645 RepID=A0AA36BG61_OCTVU|nr:Hypothetical predicted protein [Octopus vulgaris]
MRNYQSEKETYGQFTNRFNVLRKLVLYARSLYLLISRKSLNSYNLINVAFSVEMSEFQIFVLTLRCAFEQSNSNFSKVALALRVSL